MIKVLLITNKSDVTTDFIVKRLKEENVNFYRLNTEDLLSSTFLSFDFSKNQFKLFDRHLKIEIDLLKIKSVYYRRPISPIFPEENLTTGEKKFISVEIAYCLEGLYKILKNALWISSVFAIREAESKIYQLQIAQEIGLKIPNSLITNYEKDASIFLDYNKSVIKPIKSGLIDDLNNEKIIFTSLLNDRKGINRIQFYPTYFQEFIDKKADLRITVIGKKVFPALILSQEFEETKIDWRNGENLRLQYKKIILPTYISELCIMLTERLNLNFGAIDFVIDKNGEFIFLEINPNGQWAWIEKQLDYNISSEIVNLLNI